MKDIRESIKADAFPEFVKNFMFVQYGDKEVPSWIRDALATVNISV